MVEVACEHHAGRQVSVHVNQHDSGGTVQCRQFLKTLEPGIDDEDKIERAGPSQRADLVDYGDLMPGSAGRPLKIECCVLFLLDAPDGHPKASALGYVLSTAVH
jgi:hypothetical protein